jgi:hypothetical protein
VRRAIMRATHSFGRGAKLAGLITTGVCARIGCTWDAAMKTRVRAIGRHEG